MRFLPVHKSNMAQYLRMDRHLELVPVLPVKVQPVTTQVPLT